MAEYKYDPEKISEIKQSSLKRIIPFMVIIAIITIGTIAYDDISIGRFPNIDSLLMVTIFMAVVFIFIVQRALSKIKKNLESFVLIIEDDKLTRIMGKSVFSILFADISKISETNKGALCVIGKRDVEVIIVSQYLKNYDELKAFLYNLKPFETNNKYKFWQKYGLVAMLVPALLMLSVFLSENIYVVGIGGLLGVIALGWYIFKLFQVVKLDRSQRRRVLMPIVLLIAIVLKMFFTLHF